MEITLSSATFIRLAFKLTAGRIMQAAPARILNEWAVR
jgi:hypothetical protein